MEEKKKKLISLSNFKIIFLGNIIIWVKYLLKYILSLN